MAEKTQQTRKYIDPHVHCRDWNEKEKSTIMEVMALARSQGIVAIFDMPNTKPPILTKADVELRLWTAECEKSQDGYYVYIGATADAGVMEGWGVCSKNPKVVGIKMFAGKSTGDLSILDLNDQKNVYKTLKQEKYKGVIVVHCEEESLGKPDLWVPANPATWNLAIARST